jgi:hypothetical protein
MSAVAVFSYTHSVTHVADNILKSLKDIIRGSGLDPAKLVGEWQVLLAGISHWLETQHLEMVILEIFDPVSDELIHRWDINVVYNWSPDAGSFWTDTDQLRYALRKLGLAPSQARYRVMVQNKSGWPPVSGWGSGNTRSTAGMVRQSLGTTVEHNGLGAAASHWRKI